MAKSHTDISDASRWVPCVLHTAIEQLTDNPTKSHIAEVVGENRAMWTRYVFGDHAPGLAKITHWMGSALQCGFRLKLTLTHDKATVTAKKNDDFVVVSLDMSVLEQYERNAVRKSLVIQ